MHDLGIAASSSDSAFVTNGKTSTVFSVAYGTSLALGVLLLGLGLVRIGIAFLSEDWKLGGIGLVASLGSCAVGMLAVYSLAKPKTKAVFVRNASNIVLLQVSLTISVILIELILNQVFPKPTVLMVVDNVLGWSLRSNSNAVVPERLGQPPYSVSVDSNGYVNGVAGEGERTLLLIGDSMLWPSYDLAFSAPHVFEGFVGGKCKIFNAGVTGYGTDQELLRLKQGLSAIKNVCDVVFFFLPLNDFSNNVDSAIYFKNVGFVAKPRFLLKGESLVYVGPHSESFGDFEGPILERFWLFRTWSSLRNRLSDDGVKQDVGTAHKNLNFEKFFRQLYFHEPGVEFQKAQHVTARLIAEIAGECRKRKVSFHAFAFDSPTYFSYIKSDKAHFDSSAMGQLAMEKNVAETFSQAGVRFNWLILQPDELIPDDIHPNKNGMKKIAQTVAQVLTPDIRPQTSGF